MNRAVRRVCPLALLFLTAVAAASDPPPRSPGMVEVRFTDGSTVKVFLKDASVKFITPYGELSIPIGDIQKIDFATRLTDDDTKRIEEAVADLGNPLFPKREAASLVLLKLRDKAYSALLEAAKSKDAEVSRRAADLIDNMRQAMPGEQIEVRKFDVIRTEHSKISGRIEGAALKATSPQFGDVQLKLTDMRSLRQPGLPEDEAKVVHAETDPGNLAAYQDKIGKSFYFRVTGTVAATIWGDGMYTTDSQLATVAVHAGVLKPGETGVVKVSIVPSPPAFNGSTKNGVTSQPWGVFPAAYKVGR